MTGLRRGLTNEQWRLVEPFLTGKRSDRGRTGDNNRRTLDGILWILRTGAPWRDLPPRYGKWRTVHQRFIRWTRNGVFDRLAEALMDTPDRRAVMLDATFTKIHQHAAGARRGGKTPEESAKAQAIGRSTGGLTSKVFAVVDMAGQTLRIAVRPGNVAESPELPAMIDGIPADKLIADRAYDNDFVRNRLTSLGIEPTIPPRSNRLVQYWYDAAAYSTRHVVENVFADLKQFRSIATRYCKLERTYQAFVTIGAWLLNTRPKGRCGVHIVYNAGRYLQNLNSLQGWQLPLFASQLNHTYSTH